VPAEDAPGVGIHDEGRDVAGVEEDGIGGLRTDAAYGEKLPAQHGGLLREHPAQAERVSVPEKLEEAFEAVRFDVIMPG